METIKPFLIQRTGMLFQYIEQQFKRFVYLVPFLRIFCEKITNLAVFHEAEIGFKAVFVNRIIAMMILDTLSSSLTNYQPSIKY